MLEEFLPLVQGLESVQVWYHSRASPPNGGNNPAVWEFGPLGILLKLPSILLNGFKLFSKIGILNKLKHTYLIQEIKITAFNYLTSQYFKI